MITVPCKVTAEMLSHQNTTCPCALEVLTVKKFAHKNNNEKYVFLGVANRWLWKRKKKKRRERT